jgi:uncharacterized protein
MNISTDTLDPAQAGVHVQWGVKIPLRDGVHLSATLYLPENHGVPTPVIFTLTPYIAQTYHDNAMYFAANGYPFLTVDVRGRGNSEGTFRPFFEGRDGHDVVEWLARQPYCNSQVAMWGGSYAGHDQWTAAAQFPPHLATIVPVASPYIYVDFPGRNNILPPYIVQWLMLVASRTSQEKIFLNNERFWGARFRRWFESGVACRQLDTFLGLPSTIFQEWISHPQQDEYWDSYNLTPEQYAGLSIPILTITGSYDYDQLGALTHYRQHLNYSSPAARARHYLVIGPWDHAGTRAPKAEFLGLKVGPASLLDLGKLHLQWYAWTMQGGAKPEFLRKNVAYYVMGAEKWRYADTLEAITARTEPLYLHSTNNATDVFKSGSLTEELPARSDPDHYAYDPRDVGLAQLESTMDPGSKSDHRMVYASTGKQLVYHSAAFDEDIEISGFFKLSLWLSIDQPDTDFRASVYDIGMDGAAILLTADWMRARYRESLREQKLIRTREPLCYAFERFTFISRQVRKGHRLRLVIDSFNSIYSQKNYNSGGVVAEESMSDARPVTVRLYHDESHRSVLHVPMGHAET